MPLGLFPAFFDSPTGMSFAEQNSDEKIQLLLRRHPITNLPWIAVSIFALFLPLLILAANQITGFNLLSQLSPTPVIEAAIMYDFLIIGYAFQSFLFWYFNIYIVTNQHLVTIAFDSLLNRQISEIQYDEVQTVSSDIQGVFGEFFNFGTVTIETASKDNPTQFVNIPQPDDVADRIRDIQQEVG